MRVRASFCAMTSFMELILLACLIAPPDTCQEERVRVSMEPIAGHACMVGAPPLIAEWSMAHPAWRIARWRCGIAGAEGYPI
jgi:hypothetical protein